MALTAEMLEELTQGNKTPEELSKLYSQMLQHMINRYLRYHEQMRGGIPAVKAFHGKISSQCSGVKE